jgi:hypothetical protein
MEHELLPWSQEPDTNPYPRPYESHQHPPILFLKINFNIIVPSMAISSKWPLSFRHSNKNFVPISQHLLHVTCSAHLILLDMAILTIFCKEYNLGSSSFCTFIYSWHICSLDIEYWYSSEILCSNQNVYKNIFQLNLFVVYILTLFTNLRLHSIKWKSDR